MESGDSVRPRRARSSKRKDSETQITNVQKENVQNDVPIVESELHDYQGQLLQTMNMVRQDMQDFRQAQQDMIQTSSKTTETLIQNMIQASTQTTEKLAHDIVYASQQTAERLILDVQQSSNQTSEKLAQGIMKANDNTTERIVQSNANLMKEFMELVKSTQTHTLAPKIIENDNIHVASHHLEHSHMGQSNPSISESQSNPSVRESQSASPNTHYVDHGNQSALNPMIPKPYPNHCLERRDHVPVPHQANHSRNMGARANRDSSSGEESDTLGPEGRSWACNNPTTRKAGSRLPPFTASER
jgi:hypothetical protein